MEHTPGPWIVVSPKGTAVAPEWAPSERIAVTMAVGLRENDEGAFPEIGQWQPADARLIAAAPELLSQLKMAAEFISGHNECLSMPSGSGDRQWPEEAHHWIWCRVWPAVCRWNDHCTGLLEDCKAAIAKAEGRSE